eukprot:scaffold182653_cov33-Tisochrysis_lutea.AAC.3
MRVARSAESDLGSLQCRKFGGAIDPQRLSNVLPAPRFKHIYPQQAASWPGAGAGCVGRYREDSWHLSWHPSTTRIFERLDIFRALNPNLRGPQNKRQPVRLP